MPLASANSPPRFLATAATTIAVLLTITALFCALIDPFGLLPLWQHEGWNEKKFSYFMREMLIKPYQLRRQSADILLLGNSVNNTGFDMQHSFFGGNSVYSLGVAGQGIYGSLRQLQDATATHKPERIIWIVDFWPFLGKEAGNDVQSFETSDTGKRLRIRADGSANSGFLWQTVKDAGAVLLSWDAVLASLDTLRSQDRQGWHLLPDGSWGGNPVHEGKSQQKAFQYMERVFFMAIGKSCLNQPCLQAPDGSSTLRIFETALHHIHQHQLQVTLVIPPVHARWTEMLFISGQWHAYRAWKSELVALNSHIANLYQVPPLRLLDFSGYYPLTMETVPELEDKKTRIRHFHDGVHFSHETGSLILAALARWPNQTIGVALEPGNVQAQLDNMEQQHKLYAAQVPEVQQSLLQSCRSVWPEQPESCLDINAQQSARR